MLLEGVIMNKYFKLFTSVLGVACTIFACDNLDNDVIKGDGTLKISVLANVEAFQESTKTRTSIGTYNETANTILWGDNETLKIAVLGDGNISKDTWATNTTSGFNGQPTATFDFTVTPASNKTGSSYTYVGVYPAPVSVDESSVVEHKVILKTIQDATFDSYDPLAYILVARPDAGHNASNANWDAYFRRATALNKITLKNIPEPIESVEIIAPSAKKLTGGRYIDLSTGNSGEVYSGENSVTVNYATPIAGSVEKGVNCKTIWFTSWGVEIAEGESLTIIARSATKYYKRTITARAEGILFKEGFLNTLGVNMATAELLYKNYTFDLQTQSLVYDNSNHAAFTSIHDYDGMLLLAFREGTNHRPPSIDEYGCVKVLEKVGDNWLVRATISDASKDLRDPFLTEVAGHPRLYMGYNTYDGNVYQHTGTVYSDYINGNWTDVSVVNHDVNHIAWLWKVREYGNRYYSIAYLEGQKPVLLISDDGVNWTTLKVIDLEGILTEADMCFIGDKMYVCLRKDTPVSESAYWGVASYPFTDFSWTEMERHIESPELIWLPYSGKLLLAGRDTKTTGEINVTLFSASFDGSLEEITILESAIGGDKSYPGMVYRNGKLYCSWYSGTSTLSSIYVATWNVDEQ